MFPITIVSRTTPDAQYTVHSFGTAQSALRAAKEEAQWESCLYVDIPALGLRLWGSFTRRANEIEFIE